MTRKAPLPAFAQKIVGETNEQFLLRTRKPYKPYTTAADVQSDGAKAFTEGKLKTANPYPYPSVRQMLWLKGFMDAQIKKADERAGLL